MFSAHSTTSKRLFRLSYLDRREERAQQKRTVSVGALHFGPFVDDTCELDTQLRILQSVAAHMKLLLDTPEHIWRLLEKKKYLHAGWLFLLARIIYQALVRTDTEDEEDDWRAQGIDVPVCNAVYSSSVQVLTVVTGAISSSPAAMGHCFSVSSANYLQSYPISS